MKLIQLNKRQIACLPNEFSLIRTAPILRLAPATETFLHCEVTATHLCALHLLKDVCLWLFVKTTKWQFLLKVWTLKGQRGLLLLL